MQTEFSRCALRTDVTVPVDVWLLFKSLWLMKWQQQRSSCNFSSV